VTYRVAVPWGSLKVGSTVDASGVAGCNITMLVARGVLVPVQPTRKKRTPVAPVPDDTAYEPEEQ